MLRRRASQKQQADRPAADDSATTDHDDDEQAKAALLVQAKCEWAMSRYDDFAETGDEYEKQQFDRFKQRAADHAKDIKDDFYHAVACHHLISLCIHAHATDEAREWFGKKRDQLLREVIAKKFPQLTKPK